MRIFLDANILFSAALTAGAMRRLIRDLHAAGHALVADGYVWEEARRNLMVKNSAAVAELHALVSLLELHTGLAGRTGVSDPEVPGLPEKDRPVISAAVGLGCSVLITGDSRHFGAFFGHAPGGIRILSPRMAAEELL
ncbi:MAG: hypothetical protein EA427_04585 [Spirochaetaceae bacterium]|nr:MAG: hypothetical protein EA427_04585 [Spirochaetaceae bacterium]